jgi:SAM-dependent methyltransferase
VKSLREIWDEQADEWIRFARDPVGDRTNLDFNIPRFLELVPPAGRRTLDLGCGEGRIGRLLEERGHRVVGVDASPAMVRAATESIEAVVADAVKLPFADGEFDLVIAFMSLMDMDDLEGAVCETARVLDPNGRFCLAVVHPLNGTGEFAAREDDSPFVFRRPYFDVQRADVVVERDGYRIRLANFHRTVDGYGRALKGAGFAVEALREPAHPTDARWARIPLFLHVRAVKT